MIKVKKIRLVNGRGSRATRFGKAAPAKRRARRNPGHLILLGQVNPHKRGTMKKHKKHHKAPRKNPFFAKAKHSAHRAKGRRRNPNRTLLSKPVGMLKTGAFALAGLVATRQIPQLILKDKNTGFIGYLANLVVALGVGAGVSRFAGKENGTAAGIGGALYLANRIISENFSPIPKALALTGLGDAAAAGSLGAVLPTYLPYPVQYDNAGSPVIPAAIRAAAREEATALLPRPTTVSGLPGRRA